MKIVSTALCLTFLFVAASAQASTLYLDSIDNVKDSQGDNVGPYYGHLDNFYTQIYCDDLIHNIGVPAVEAVNVSTINDLSKTRFGVLAGATSLYQQIFYLSTYLSTATTQRADIQDAMWSYFDPSEPNATKASVKVWLDLAAANYTGKDYSTFRIATDSSNQFKGIQELFVNLSTSAPGVTSVGTPEPASLALILSGLGGLGLLRSRRNKV